MIRTSKHKVELKRLVSKDIWKVYKSQDDFNSQSSSLNIQEQCKVSDKVAMATIVVAEPLSKNVTSS